MDKVTINQTTGNIICVNEVVSGQLAVGSLVGKNGMPVNLNADVVANGITQMASANITNRLTIPINPGNLNGTVPGSLSYVSSTQQLAISDGNKWYQIPANNNYFVFRPSYSGSNTNNIFGSWTAMYNELIKIDGQKYIEFDNSLIPNSTPIVIPPGNWDMSSTTWYVPTCSLLDMPDLFIPITVSDGATLNGLCEINGLMTITYYGTTAPAITINNPLNTKHVNIVLQNGAHLTCAGTQPFLKVYVSFFEIVVGFGAHLVQGTTPIIDVTPTITGPSTFTICVMGSSSTVDNNVFSGTWRVVFIRLAPAVTFSIPVNQPALSMYQVLSQYSSPDVYDRTVNPTINDDNNIGYKLGDTWINTSTNQIWFASSVTTAAAVWNGPY